MKRIKGLYFFLLDKLNAFLWNMCYDKKCHSMILMYHEITAEEIKETKSTLHSLKEITLTIERLTREGYEFVHLRDAVKLPPKGHKYVAITFDDVSESMYKLAYPLLKARNIPFTLFVATGFIDKQGMINEVELEKMAQDDLCTIGAHTLSHPMLRNEKEKWGEIYESKKQLESKLDREVKYFAYPYGKHSSVSCSVMKQAKKARFEYALGTIDAPISSITQRCKYYLPRMVLHR